MKRLVIVTTLFTVLATPLLAQHAHTADMTHTAGAQAPLPTEPGQGAFAAIAEITAMLRADPATDWSSVDINALRAHLVDMDHLVSDAQVTAVPVDGGLEMTIATTGPGSGAVRRMVPAHGPVLAGETGWDSALQTTDSALIWTVTSPDDSAIIRALGFFGLMATGDHHRAHHLAIATGVSPH